MRLGYGFFVVIVVCGVGLVCVYLGVMMCGVDGGS